MIAREVLPEEKEKFNAIAQHPLQSWEWGEFRQATGKRVIRLGVFEDSKMKAAYQLTVHPIYKLPYCILYLPRSPLTDKAAIAALYKLGQQKKAIMIKMEPNVSVPLSQSGILQKTRDSLQKEGLKPGRPLFTKYTFQLDLTSTEEKILASMKSKTRYNIRLAQRHGVEVVEDNSDKAYGTFIKLFFETTSRQKFYGRTPDYYRKMKEILVPAGIEHLLLAKYKNEVLAAYVFFIFKDTLYYPYGGSGRGHKEKMPTYALFWEAIKLGKKLGLKKFDMWGTPGPNPSPKDPWYGFHHFKEGFGAKMVEFVGTWDLIINPAAYRIYNLANSLRWKILRAKSQLTF
jgi:lipid II:glycine glycyltransferase (peptidoglycan interpeptide bridge formation enzyme)